jgi:23S rRNA pseudouridine2605 synthase
MFAQHTQHNVYIRVRYTKRMEERVQKIISNSGYCARRKAEELIAAGKVRVNGRIIHLGDKADIDKDEIYVNTFLLQKNKLIYIMLNKPKHYEATLSTTVDKSVLDLIPVNTRIFPVGRLDKNTTGLLLLTNDGDFSNKITHPRYEKEKTYFVKLDKKITDKDIAQLQEGVYLQDAKVKAKVKIYHRDQLEVTIHEGKKWIIKRMFFKLGYYVKELSRTRIGNLKMDVKIGKWRYLTNTEVQALMK